MISNLGLTGLVNLGNTCYMNSAIQCLSNTRELTDFFLSKEYEKKMNTDHKYAELVLQWYKLINAIWNDNCTIIPKSFDTTVKTFAKKYNLNNNFTNYGQNDVHEFILFIIDNMHEVLSKKVSIKISGEIKTDFDKLTFKAMKNWESHFKNDYSKIIDIFYGQIITIINTPDGNILSTSFDPICFYTLPIPNNKTEITIYDCIDLYCSSELLSGDNQFFCDKSNTYLDAFKTTKFWNLPNVLIVCLNRFNNELRKINNMINFPTHLDLDNYCEGYNKDNNYELYGICNHSGGTLGGHYYAYCKNINGNWYNYNDSSVTKIEEANIYSNAAYCLFYRKIDN
jgi:ubiquitin carboxyl-terminal hydrolase 2/21